MRMPRSPPVRSDLKPLCNSFLISLTHNPLSRLRDQARSRRLFELDFRRCQDQGHPRYRYVSWVRYLRYGSA